MNKIFDAGVRSDPPGQPRSRLSGGCQRLGSWASGRVRRVGAQTVDERCCSCTTRAAVVRRSGAALAFSLVLPIVVELARPGSLRSNYPLESSPEPAPNATSKDRS
jgi:hypothetical protein